MDPVLVVPVELLSYIWNRVELTDLLQCRLVCRRWNDCLSEDAVWAKFCTSKKRREQNWKRQFVAERSLIYNWKKMRYRSFELDVEGMIRIEEDLYILNGTNLDIFSPKFNTFRTICFEDDIVNYEVDRNVVILETDRGVKVLDKQFSLLTFIQGRYESHNDQGLVAVGKEIYFSDYSKVKCVPTEHFTKIFMFKKYLLLKSVRLTKVEYSIYRKDEWSSLATVCCSPLGHRTCLEFVGNEYFLLIQYLLFDDRRISYSDAKIWDSERLLYQIQVRDGQEEYFRCGFFGSKIILTVSDDRIATIDGKKKSVFCVSPKIISIHASSEEIFGLSYTNRFEVWRLDRPCKLYEIASLHECVRMTNNLLVLWVCGKLKCYNFDNFHDEDER